jgi:hypothetical protein
MVVRSFWNIMARHFNYPIKLIVIKLIVIKPATL